MILRTGKLNDTSKGAVMSSNGNRKKMAKKGILFGAGAVLAAICPPAAVGVAAATFLGSARKYAKSGDVQDAQGLVSGYADLSGSSGDKAK